MGRAYRKLFHYNGFRHIFYSIIRLRSILLIGFLTGQQVVRIPRLARSFRQPRASSAALAFQTFEFSSELIQPAADLIENPFSSRADSPDVYIYIYIYICIAP